SAQGLNRYSYVENNPLTFVDPSGFQEQPSPATYVTTVGLNSPPSGAPPGYTYVPTVQNVDDSILWMLTPYRPPPSSAVAHGPTSTPSPSASFGPSATDAPSASDVASAREGANAEAARAAVGPHGSIPGIAPRASAHHPGMGHGAGQPPPGLGGP